ncbi:hypothetical protein O6H91_15G070800 [Diphasiastrum complanatum]|uniref:Uncharacterized protein n=2 Tax=Diphasiastrum complanatum TaxID=34168 RepID=A0ACC2BJF4_DIPCM|nr:hypothetical protein O6H91_15G070800 [Diphasiastrum complanatum]KAJ7529909.1 hypothetical protein O6H91_15G070800 [Diphasiastrum complanatum]
MAALQFGGLHTTCIARPFPVNKVKRCALLMPHNLGDCVAVGIQRSTKLKSHDLTWQTTSSNQKCPCTIRTRTYTLKTVAFQAVAADHDSEGSDTAVPSAQGTNFMSDWQQTEKLRNFLISTSDGLQDFTRTLRKPGMSKLLEIFIQGLRSKLQGLKKESFLSVLQNSEISERWQTTEPWIAWPVAIFATSYLMMTIIFGFGVTNELMPFWIMGPLMTGFLMKTTYDAINVTKEIAEKSSGYQLVIREKCFQLYEDARTGNIPAKIATLGASKLEEFKMVMATKKKVMVLYVQSGQAYLDFLSLLSRLGDSIMERYHDFKEWIWPSWRRFIRFLQKIF